MVSLWLQFYFYVRLFFSHFRHFFSSRKRKSDRIAFLLINEPNEWMNIYSRKSGSCHKWLNYGFGIFSFWLNECAQFAYRMHDDDNTHSLTHTHNQPLMNEPLYSFYGYVKSTNNGGNDEVVGSIRAHTQSPSNPIQSNPFLSVSVHQFSINSPLSTFMIHWIIVCLHAWYVKSFVFER